MLLLGVVSLASCSQDDGIEGENMGTLQGFQISVSEDGFQAVNAPGTRATENNYTTKFSEGDMIGIFAVKGENIVEDINNRQFTYQDGEWVLTDGEDAIEYKGSEFSKMSFMTLKLLSNLRMMILSLHMSAIGKLEQTKVVITIPSMI